jgi:RelA/SpoT family protein
LPSIRHKLERFNGMELARMQDIGGCRAVLSSVAAVDELVSYFKRSRTRHRLVREYPYIREPKESGYRGVHLVYSYNSPRRATWNGLQVEIQIRSRLQHAWATAVETVGTFTQQALKSSLGQDEWLDFFALMSSALALREGTPIVPGTPDDPNELMRQLRRLVGCLDVINRLQAYGAALQIVGDFADERGMTYVLELDVANSTLTTSGFTDPIIAADAYTAIERAIEGQLGKDVVMVAMESVNNLQRAEEVSFKRPSRRADVDKRNVDQSLSSLVASALARRHLCHRRGIRGFACGCSHGYRYCGRRHARTRLRLLQASSHPLSRQGTFLNPGPAQEPPRFRDGEVRAMR